MILQPAGCGGHFLFTGFSKISAPGQFGLEKKSSISPCVEIELCRIIRFHGGNHWNKAIYVE